MDDWTLLRAYAQKGDQDAFTTLVERHIALVYYAAYRQLGDRTAAEEIAQAVFTKLASKAASLKPNGVLAAWLYRVACRQAADFRRQESARKRREQQHADVMIDPQDEDNSEVHWAEIAPLLDEAMQSLTEAQRSAVLLRVFEKRPLAEVGEALGIGEEAARKRVSRALDQLRVWFERRGIHCTSHTLGLTVGAFSASPIATHFIESTVRTALEQGAAISISSTSTSTLITMASMKVPLILGLIAGAAVPISLGYFASSRTEPELPRIARSGATVELPDAEAEASDLLAEWKRLREEHGPDAGSMSALYQAIDSIDDEFRRQSFRTALLTEWAEIDPRGAIAFFEAERDSLRVETILSLWIKRDPQAAIAAMKGGGDTVRATIGNLLTEIAVASPSNLADLAPLVEVMPYLDTRIRDAFTVAARHDLSTARRIAQRLKGDVRKDALCGLAEAWGELDGAGGLAWVEQLESSEERSKALQRLLVGWAKSDTTTALDHLTMAPPGGGRLTVGEPGTADLVLSAAMRANPDATLDWLAVNVEDLKQLGINTPLGPLEERLKANIPGTLEMICDHPAAKVLEKALIRFVRNQGARRNSEVWEWLQERPPSAQIDRLKIEVFVQVAAEDSEKGMMWAEAIFTDPSISNQDAARAADSLIHGKTDASSMHALLESAPAEIRPELLKAGFRAVEEQDISFWVDRLNELPAADRPDAIHSLTSVHARTDPAAAIAWSENLSPTERPAAFGGIASTWAEADSYATSEWIAQLPPGIERDYAATALVEAVAKAEPGSAWIWAQTIADPEHRRRALLTALNQFGNDADVIIEQSALSEAEKVLLLSGTDEQLER